MPFLKLGKTIKKWGRGLFTLLSFIQVHYSSPLFSLAAAVLDIGLLTVVVLLSGLHNIM